MNPGKEETPAAAFVAQLVRESQGYLLAGLIRQLRDIALAEDCLQEAIASALVHWRRNGIPRSPQGWLLQTARRKAIDRFRRVKAFAARSAEYAIMLEQDENTGPEDPPDIADDRLRLIFTCCHPALDRRSSVALTLRLLCGLTVAEIARAFLDTPETVAQRIVRAKRKIKAAGIPYETPGPGLWDERLDAVLHVVYLVFNEGYATSGGDSHIRPLLSGEAIRLARILNTLRPGEGEIEGLLALMLLHDSRRRARLGADGALVPLESQQRRLWDRALIAEGEALVVQALRRGGPGPFRLQAAISAVHAGAVSFEATDWPQIVLLYRELAQLSGNPVIAVNMAVALSYAQGVAPALEMMVKVGGCLHAYQPFHACIADLHRRAGNWPEAAQAYRTAMDLTENEAERRFLGARLASLDRGDA